MRIVSFALAFTLGLLMANVFRSETPVLCESDFIGISKSEAPVADSQLKILAKPQARYTDAARKNNVNGTVVLKVVFASDGTVGNIQTVTNLPDGLTEEAVTAARQIRFEPARRNGKSVSMTKTVSYIFTIY